jgi:bifunctional UDP-N-acetylglucosamine pyrophosphorylase / glucosamine-1-phosphate N-acetyltransferase
MSTELSIVVLAAGQGTRMRSPLPKVLHQIGGKPMLAHVIRQAKLLKPAQLLVVYGHGGELLKEAFSHEDITWVEQAKQRGTADAVSKAMPFIPASHRVLVLYGDVPLLSAKTLETLISGTPAGGVGIVTAKVAKPFGLGRIVRNAKGAVERIVEEKDASEVERAITEINSGIVLFDAKSLATWLPQVGNDNAQGEYYLTDVTALAAKEKAFIYTCSPSEEAEIAGVNSRLQQAELERLYQRMQAYKLLSEGVEISCPNRFDVRGELYAESEVYIDINTLFEGVNHLHRGCKIGANCILINCEIGEGAIILANSYLENAKVGKEAIVGPFARLRPGAILSESAHIGNFVEIKNSFVGIGTKINHLSYIGDAVVGNNVNIGAGTITCNYDGANKHQTIIEDDVHIGSDSQLVAPVRIGRGATIGAGSTLTKDAPADQLTLTHKLEHRSQHWQRPVKAKDNDK